MSASNGTIPPLLMLRSFLTIASGLVLQWLSFAVVMYLLANTWFPEFLAGIKEDPDFPVPQNLFLGTIVGAGVASLLVGFFVGWSAPFGRLVHAIFLAVIVAVQYLQQSMGMAPENKYVAMTSLLVFPMAILLGGYFANQLMAKQDHLAENEEPSNG